MPAALLSKPEILDRLMLLFRQRGYDGASLADIAEVTGRQVQPLSPLSGGKNRDGARGEAHLASKLEPALERVRGPGTPRTKLNAFLGVVEEVYDSGRLACLLERLCASAERKKFAKPLRSTFESAARGVRVPVRRVGAESRPSPRPAPKTRSSASKARWCSAPGSTSPKSSCAPSARSRNVCSMPSDGKCYTVAHAQSPRPRQSGPPARLRQGARRAIRADELGGKLRDQVSESWRS